MRTHATTIADHSGNGVTISRLVFDYFEPTVIAKPAGFRKVYPLGKPSDDRPYEKDKPGTEAAIKKANEQRIATYRPVMLGKGWLAVAQIHAVTGICPDSIRQRLKKLTDSGHVSARRDDDGSVFFRWIGA